jgi:hypothetical protein
VKQKKDDTSNGRLTGVEAAAATRGPKSSRVGGADRNSAGHIQQREDQEAQDSFQTGDQILLNVMKATVGIFAGSLRRS